MKLSKTREELVKMYIDSLKEGEIPWKKRWINESNINGISKIEYHGINQLILNYFSYVERYTDNRWFTYNQIKDMGLKLENAKNKGVPIEFWSAYNFIHKKKYSFKEYNEYIEHHPDEKNNFRIILRTAFVFNGNLVKGLKPLERKTKHIEPSKYIENIIKKLDINYSEIGNKAYYDPVNDKIVLPPKEQFIDKYSYYATQLHEISHATGNSNRLNRELENNLKEDYAREELIAEISSSFLMQKLNIPASAEHYNNHKAYIKSWIDILENKNSELFNAISEANKIYKYLNDIDKNRIKNIEKLR